MRLGRGEHAAIDVLQDRIERFQSAGCAGPQGCAAADRGVAVAALHAPPPASCGARANKIRVYEMVDDPVARESEGALRRAPRRPRRHCFLALSSWLTGVPRGLGTRRERRCRRCRRQTELAISDRPIDSLASSAFRNRSSRRQSPCLRSLL